MTTRRIFVEGPDDVSALIELSKRLFGATPKRHRAGAPRLERDTTLISGAHEVQISAAPNAKDGLPGTLHGELERMNPQFEGDEGYIDRIAFLYDPDGDAPDAFVNRVDRELEPLSRASSPWSIVRSAEDPSRWELSRQRQSPVSLRGIAWRTSGPVLDGLKDLQNLERLLCDVLERAYPEQKPRVERWLEEIRVARREIDPQDKKELKWKAAILLWAALVDESATSDAGIASRFLGQHKRKGVDDFFKTHVDPVIEAAALREPLAWIFG